MRNIGINKVVWTLSIILLNVIKSSEQASYTCNATASCGCSSSNTATLNRIVGGENAATSTWGWAVYLYIGSGSLCGGSIISSSWIITAAHCVRGVKASQVNVYAGSIIRGYYAQTSVASCIVIHPSYDTSTYVYDIALIKLASPFSMSDTRLAQICLPSVSAATLAAGEWPAVGTTVIAVGWGRLNESGSLPTTLQQVTVQTIAFNNPTCTPSMYNWQVQFCAGISGGGKDTCQGDSGGPLMMFASSNQWVLVGLTSNGIGCARPTNAGVYTRVAAFQDWINSTMNDPTCHSTSIYNLSSCILLFFSIIILFLRHI